MTIEHVLVYKKEKEEKNDCSDKKGFSCLIFFFQKLFHYLFLPYSTNDTVKYRKKILRIWVTKNRKEKLVEKLNVMAI